MRRASRSARAVRALAGALMLTAGCHFGNTVATFPPAQSPSGVTVSIDTAQAGTYLVGELLAIDSAGMHVLADTALTPPRLFLVSYSRVRRMSLHRVDLTLKPGQPSSPTRLAEVRRLARFPQGLTDPLRDRLLAAYGIPRMEEVR